MIDLTDIQRVAGRARLYLTERKKYERLTAKHDDNLSPKQAQKLNADLNWQAMELEKIEAALHAACVDAGLAELRDESAYRERIFRPSGWHTYNFQPPKPRGLKP